MLAFLGESTAVPIDKDSYHQKFGKGEKAGWGEFLPGTDAEFATNQGDSKHLLGFLASSMPCAVPVSLTIALTQTGLSAGRGPTGQMLKRAFGPDTVTRSPRCSSHTPPHTRTPSHTHTRAPQAPTATPSASPHSSTSSRAAASRPTTPSVRCACVQPVPRRPKANPNPTPGR